jgi:hypothetical protein
VADQIRNVVPSLPVGKDYNPQTGQQSLNVDANRVRILGKGRDGAGAGTLTVLVAGVTGMSIVVTKIIMTASAAPAAGAKLVVTEDLGQGDANVILDTDWPIQVYDTDFKPPLKGNLVGKGTSFVWTPGGTANSTLDVYGFFE